MTNLKYLHTTFWQSLDNPAQTAKIMLTHTQESYTHVGRFLMPILL